MKAWHGAALLAGAFVVGALVCRPDRSLAEAERAADSLRAVAEELTARDARRSADSASAAAESRRRQARLDSLDRRLTAAVTRNAELRQQLESAGPTVPRVLVDQIVAGKDAEISTLTASRDITHAELVSVRVLLSSADSSRQEWRVLVGRLQGELDRSLKHRRWGCVVGFGPVGGAAIAGNATQSTVGVGAAVGIGIVCGRKFL